MGRFWNGFSWEDEDEPKDKDQWFEDYEQQLDEEDEYGDFWD